MSGTVLAVEAGLLVLCELGLLCLPSQHTLDAGAAVRCPLSLLHPELYSCGPAAEPAGPDVVSTTRSLTAASRCKLLL